MGMMLPIYFLSADSLPKAAVEACKISKTETHLKHSRKHGTDARDRILCISVTSLLSRRTVVDYTSITDTYRVVQMKYKYSVSYSRPIAL